MTASLPAGFPRRGAWLAVRYADPAEVTHLRALRLTGTLDEARLADAVRQVTAALPALRVELVDGEPLRLRVRPGAADPARTDLRHLTGPARDHACAELLRTARDRPADRAEAHRARFHLVRLADDEIVLALTAHSLVLDARSVYALLGAVCQAYTGRFRAEQYRDPTPTPTTGPGPGAEPLAPLAPLSERARASRRRWWTRRLAALPAPADTTAGAARRGRESQTHRLRVPAGRWEALTTSAGPLGGNGSLAVMAVAAWCLRTPDSPGPGYFSTVVDLRDHLELGPLLGPFSDRLPFGVDLSGLSAPSFHDVLLRTQAGFLDAVVHYLPYDEVVALGVELGRIAPPRTAAHWDVTLHFCRNPPASSATRGERTLAEQGLSIELFRESDLLGAATSVPADRWDGVALDLRPGESGPDTELVLDIDRHHPRLGHAEHVLQVLDRTLDAAVTAPDAPLPPPHPAPTTRRLP
ncbi:hypothetical protein GCM10009544_62270 [Streptomyces stramineus]|uniref:Condensation domain-containing protein n=1 Tax=Streptomyces stramineus TaxID=173861 RepID=A0ABN1BAL6_9ACTN